MEGAREGGGSQYKSCFHSNPNIAAMKSELRWETGANGRQSFDKGGNGE